VASSSDYWIPDWKDETSLALFFEKRFEWFMQPQEYIEMLRVLYVCDGFDPGGPSDYKITYSDEDIEGALQRVRPGFVFNDEQRERLFNEFRQSKEEYSYREFERVQAIDPTRGTISVFDLSARVVPELGLYDFERDRLLSFLNQDGSRMLYAALGLGDLKLNKMQKEELSEVLDRLGDRYQDYFDLIDSYKIEAPALFKEQPQFVRFALTQFFREIPFGEREAILAELETTGEGELSRPEAMKRFLEVVGAEKIGQFLARGGTSSVMSMPTRSRCSSRMVLRAHGVR